MLVVVSLTLMLASCTSDEPVQEPNDQVTMADTEANGPSEGTISGHPGFERVPNVPPGMLSRPEAVQRSKETVRRFLLEFKSASAKFGNYTIPAETKKDLGPPVPAWKVRMFGAFKWGGLRSKDWMVVIHGRTGHLYESTPD